MSSQQSRKARHGLTRWYFLVAAASLSLSIARVALGANLLNLAIPVLAVCFTFFVGWHDTPPPPRGVRLAYVSAPRHNPAHAPLADPAQHWRLDSRVASPAGRHAGPVRLGR